MNSILNIVLLLACAGCAAGHILVTTKTWHRGAVTHTRSEIARCNHVTSMTTLFDAHPSIGCVLDDGASFVLVVSAGNHPGCSRLYTIGGLKHQICHVVPSDARLFRTTIAFENAGPTKFAVLDDSGGHYDYEEVDSTSANNRAYNKGL